MVAVLVVAALVATVVVLALDLADARGDAALLRAARSATAAARKDAELLTSYDYRTSPTPAWTRQRTTERFRRYFRQVSRRVAPATRTLRASATGDVVDAAARARDRHHVVVLAFVDQRVRARGGHRLVDELRLRLEMVHSHGRWLLDAVRMENRAPSAASRP